MLKFFLPLVLVIAASTGLHAASVSGVVWVDVNRNGIRDEGERRQAKTGLKLYVDKNGDGFPERLVARTTSDAKGRYSFAEVEPGLHSVGLELRSLPDEIYEATRLNVGEEDRDNDLNRNTLRTQPFEVKDRTEVLNDLADVGLVVGSAEVEYLGKENYVSLTGHRVECDVYLYKGLKLCFPSHHGRLKPDVIKQWMQWLKLTDSIQQQLFVSEAFLDGGMARELGAGNLDAKVGHRPLAYAGGTFASSPRSEGDDVGKVLLDDPDDFHRHWTLIYEMGRVHPGPWHFRATWPPYTFMNAHFQTALVLHELGGEEALKVPNPYNGLAYHTNISGLDFWERSDYKFAKAFQPDFNDRGVELFHEGERNYLWGGSINMIILFHIYRKDGFEKMVEVLQNMARKQRLVSTAAQAGLDFSEAVNDATDGKYARKLIEDWGMPDPAKYVFRSLGQDTGDFVDKDEYRWDCIPYNSEEVAEGYAPLTEKSMRGYVRWTRPPGWATRMRDGQLGAASQRDQTIVGVGYNFQDVDGPNSYREYLSFLDRNPTPNEVDTRKVGELRAEETDNVKDYYVARWSGKLFVPKTGVYEFKLSADDWSKLIVGGELAGSNYHKNGEFSVTLKKGRHDFKLAFGELAGAARLNFEFDPALKFMGAAAKDENDDALPAFERFDDASIEGWKPVSKGAFTLRHELRPAVWEVTIGFSNVVQTHGVCIAAEGSVRKSDVILPQHAFHEETFEVEVRDGSLDLSFWNEPSAFNSIGISSLRVKRVRELPQ